MHVELSGHKIQVQKVLLVAQHCHHTILYYCATLSHLAIRDAVNSLEVKPEDHTH